jgi:hypothetical protein
VNAREPAEIRARRDAEKASVPRGGGLAAARPDTAAGLLGSPHLLPGIWHLSDTSAAHIPLDCLVSYITLRDTGKQMKLFWLRLSIAAFSAAADVAPVPVPYAV